jgi:hypothetical protein
MQEVYVVTKEFDYNDIDYDDMEDHTPDLILAFRDRRLANEYVEARQWDEKNRGHSYTIHVVPLADAPAR